MAALLRCTKLAGTCLRQPAVHSAFPNVLQLTVSLARPQRASLQRCLSTSLSRWTNEPEDHSSSVVVYRGQLSGNMRRLKIFSLFTSAIGVYATPTVMAEMSKAGMGIAIMMGSIMGMFTLITPLLIHLVVRNYVTEMTYDAASDRYTATTISLFLRKRTLTFGVDDVAVPTVPGMFTTFHAKGRPLFADGAQFEPMEHFGRLMGYDRPVDFMLKKPHSDKSKR